MMKYLLFLSLFILTDSILLSQAQLVQTCDGANSGDYFGKSISDAGDVNGDGWADIMVSSPYYNSNVGRVYIYFGGNNPDNIADIIIDGEGGNYKYFGSPLSSAGDVNNDGYDDIIVASSGYSSAKDRVYIYYGGSSMDTTPDVTIDASNTTAQFGSALSTAGDVNNDGYDDVIIGDYYFNSRKGIAYVFYGGSSMDNGVDVTLLGFNVDADQFGISVSTAGDVNNDGADDVIVGENLYASDQGKAYIFYGNNSGNMDATFDVELFGGSSYDEFGWSVSTAGDVNGDGFDDVIVGARYTYRGNAYIFYGGSNMNAGVDVTLEGEASDDIFGYAVSDAGDVNHDNYADVVIGAKNYDSYSGKAYVYYGGSSMDATADFTMTGENEDDELGAQVSGAGDFNADGYDDIIVGTAKYNSNTGRVYAYSDPLAPMPVELTSFSAERIERSKVLISWETATELNNYGFEVQRENYGQASPNNGYAATGWKKIGFVEGCGNSNSPKRYTFFDESEKRGKKFAYRLKQIDNDGSFEYSNEIEIEIIPAKYELNQNYPNPFNPTTRIAFSLPESGNVKLLVYDLLGKNITELVNEEMEAGFYEREWDASQFSSGVYLYLLSVNGNRFVKKMNLIK